MMTPDPMTVANAQDDAGLRPEEFAEAAEAPIADAKDREPRAAARVLAEAGLTGVAAAEDCGGLGLPLAFALPIAEAAGRLQLRFPLVEQMLLARALGGEAVRVGRADGQGDGQTGAAELAGAIASGERLATIAWQGSLADGFAGHARGAADSDWLLVADGPLSGDGFPAAGGASLIERAGLAIETDDALDPDQPLAWIDLSKAKVLASLSADAFAELQRDAAILYAGFVTGAAAGAIKTTATHVATRVQFGRPLSAKQAVRHWMSRMQLATEASAAATRRVLEADAFGQPRDGVPTLAGAIANAAFVLEKAIHLHGGMGFTWEMPLHYSLRDIRAIDAAFGSSQLVKDIGWRFIEAA